MPHPALPWTGRCLCGQVKVTVTKPAIVTMACHCTGCQKLSASAFSLTVALPEDGLEIEGELAVGALHGASPYMFCPHCLNWIYTKPQEAMGMVFLRPSVLDNHAWYSPFVETMTEEKLAWASTPAKYSFPRWPDPADYGRIIQDFAGQDGA